ncbi:hypothetical protein ACHHYP_03880 [Achlya hypogyna]|uniref:DNA 5'-3' helicase FANCJ n=1 Tax=Achlya hypogyna TaxID=1202772 RepID=A0A1V9ZPN6_ACHHY|nr:hypothetical protein ACHHYP_03880 [Achlya hypogyna]
MEIAYEEAPVKKSGMMIAGYTVDFPEGKSPFPSQLAVMAKVLLALKKKQNALLESPTGSGKTLALLCSTLAWQRQFVLEAREQERAQLEEAAAQQVAAAKSLDDSVISIDDDDDFERVSFSQFAHPKKRKLPDSLLPYADPTPATEPAATATPEVTKVPARERTPTIYFCSRTHSQLTQVIQELRRCPHGNQVKMVVLGSKKHYCVHNKVRNLDAGKINDECSSLQEKMACKFRRKLKIHNELRRAVPAIWDIEELVALGEDVQECPYYYTHSAVEQASLVFCPYNYIMDPSIRAAVKIDLKSAIVILDEAHNIEDVCRSAASMELTYLQLEEAIASFKATIEAQVHKSPMYLTLLKLLNGLQRWLRYIEEIKVLKTVGYEHEAHTWPGTHAVAVLAEFCNVKPDNLGTIFEMYQAVATEERAADDDNLPAAASSDEKDEGVVKLTSTALMTVLAVLNVATFMFRDELKYINDYKLVVDKSRPFTGFKELFFAGSRRCGRKTAQMQLKMCLWCLHAGVAFADITAQVRSVVLTSGTLSPMTSFADELGTTFPITLEANHVVDMRRQVFLGSVMTGGGGRRVDLSASYQNQQDITYQDGLGHLVLKYSRIVPGGLLVFLPSYRLMNQLYDRWQVSGLLDEIAAVKEVFQEPRGAGKDFDELLEAYKDAIARHRPRDCVDLTAEPAKTGAVFLAVFRGKVSEGIDFSNDNARCVLAVGIPFPNVKEPQVALKQEYQNQRALADPRSCNGRVWYEHQAFRALNQALGRCIRHRLDYGAILLVDSRHRGGRYAGQLSKWTRGHLKEYEHTNFAAQDLAQFFARVAADPALAVPVEETPPVKTTKPATKAKKPAQGGWIDKKAVSKKPRGNHPNFIAPGTISGWMASYGNNA